MLLHTRVYLLLQSSFTSLTKFKILENTDIQVTYLKCIATTLVDSCKTLHANIFTQPLSQTGSGYIRNHIVWPDNYCSVSVNVKASGYFSAY